MAICVLTTSLWTYLCAVDLSTCRGPVAVAVDAACTPHTPYTPYIHYTPYTPHTFEYQHGCLCVVVPSGGKFITGNDTCSVETTP